MSIDAFLYRPLKDGRKYNDLIPAMQGVDFSFEPAGKFGDTYDSLIYMDRWAEKYAWQTKEIAPLLQGRTVRETADNIYNWLYNHFQYKLDQDTQLLYAPSAAWAYREDGFDCKTFSILASCILRNLGIPHSFRKVQQKTVNPGMWSHVYVVAFDGNKPHIIDATRHSNTEVSYTKKHDHMIQLKHKGLAFPGGGLGCPDCGGRCAISAGLGNPAVLNPRLERFYQFLDVLEANGAPRSFTSLLNNEFAAHINAGIDPNFMDVVKKVLYHKNGLGLPTWAMTAINSGAGQAIIGQVEGQIQAQSAQLMANVQNGIMGMIDKIIPMNFVNKTFGAVFANGFNLSCWGASLTPQDAKFRIDSYYKPFLNTLVQRVQQSKSPAELEATANEYVRYTYIFYHYYEVLKMKQADWSSCAKKAINDVYKPFFRAAKSAADQVVAQLVEKGAIVTKVNQGDFRYTLPMAMMPGQTKDYISGRCCGHNTSIDIPKLDLSPIEASLKAQGNQPIPGGPTAGNPNGQATASKSPNTGLLLMGGLVAAAFLVMPRFSKNKGALGRPKASRRKVNQNRK